MSHTKDPLLMSIINKHVVDGVIDTIVIAEEYAAAKVAELQQPTAPALKPFNLQRALKEPQNVRSKSVDKIPDDVTVVKDIVIILWKGGNLGFWRTNELDDLFMAPRTVTKWVNMYEEYGKIVPGREFYDSYEKAKEASKNCRNVTYLRTTKITWED